MPQKMKTHRSNDCTLTMHRARFATLNARRPSGASAPSSAYGRRWRRLRRYVLARQPLCADPFGHHAEDGRIEIASEVDHIVPRSAGGGDAIENLQGLCNSCHSRKTAMFDGGFGRERMQTLVTTKHAEIVMNSG